jgi:hypothetical protein
MGPESRSWRFLEKRAYCGFGSSDQISFQGKISKNHPPKPSKFPTIWDERHAVNAHVQSLFSKTKKHWALVYTWQVPSEDLWKKSVTRSLKPSGKS